MVFWQYVTIKQINGWMICRFLGLTDRMRCMDWLVIRVYLDVSKNRGTPKSSILIGFSIINHPFWGTPIFGNTHFHICCFDLIWFDLFYFTCCEKGVSDRCGVFWHSCFRTKCQKTFKEMARRITRIHSWGLLSNDFSKLCLPLI